MGNEVRIKTSIDDKVTTPLKQMESGFEKFGKKVGSTIGGGSEIAKGIGLAAGVAAFGLVGNAISAVTGFLGDSAAAYADDQRSIQQLNASLKANVAGWDGNTSAINDTIKAHLALGFSDDEQRDSLAKLVAATHDSTKALEIQRTAMDLARFKNISLGDATEALTKVEAGSFRILKSLGIELKAGATQTEALAAVQAVAAGQAETYANTNEGKLLVSQVRVHEAEEKFGKSLSTLSTVIMPAAASAVEDLAYAFDRTAMPIEQMEKAAAAGSYGAISQFNHVQEAAQQLGVSVEEAWKLMGEAGSQNVDDIKYWEMVQSDAMDHAERKSWTAAGAAADAGKDTGATLKTMSADYATFAGKATKSLDKVYLKEKHLTDELSALANQAISDYFDPIITADKLMADQAELSAQKKIAASKKSTKAEVADAKARIHELEKSTTEERIALFEAGKLSKKEQGTLLSDLKKDWASATGSAKARIGELIAEIERLQRSGNVKIGVGFLGSTGRGGAHAFASGGHYNAGEPRIVGERGPEWDIPDHSGTIVPNGAAPSVGSSHPHVIQLVVGRRVLAQVVADEDGYGRNNPTFQPA